MPLRRAPTICGRRRRWTMCSFYWRAARISMLMIRWRQTTLRNGIRKGQTRRERYSMCPHRRKRWKERISALSLRSGARSGPSRRKPLRRRCGSRLSMTGVISTVWMPCGKRAWNITASADRFFAAAVRAGVGRQCGNAGASDSDIRPGKVQRII